MAQVEVQAHAVLHHRKAESSCHGAKLMRLPQGGEHAFECLECGQPCERVLSEPREVHAHG